MATKKRSGLGSGLGALLANSESEFEDSFGLNETKPATKHTADESAVSGNTSIEINIDSIDPNENQPRKNFDEVAMTELANSIRMHGVISPIIVVKSGKRHMIIAGERRWRASKRAGLKTIPAIIRDYTELQVKEISLIENLQREDLNPIETAIAIKQLMEDYKYTQEEVSDRIGKSRSAVANTLRLLTLTDDVMQLVSDGKLSSGHARCLVVVNDAESQLKLAMEGIDNKISVRDLEKKVKAFLKPKTASNTQQQQSIELKDLISRMQRIFATKVSALGNDNRGRIYLDYYTRDDLDRIVELMEALEGKQE